MKLKMKTIGRWLVFIAAICWSVAALAQSHNSSDVNLTGAWKGTRRTTGLGRTVNQIQSIELGLTQKGDTLSGSYKCYAGKKATTDCPNPRGKIVDGTISDGKVKIDVRTLPSDITCNFTGSVVENKMNGDYTCYAGGSLSSIGVWKASRH